MSAPDDTQCGFVHTSAGGVDGDTLESDRWEASGDELRCRRPAWDYPGADRCIWHADIGDKPAGELADARGDGDERLDGVVLREADLGDAVPFGGCDLAGADLSGANLRSGSLAGADLREADLSGAVLWDCDLTGADLRDATLRGAVLWRATAARATLRNATLAGTELWDADLPAADLRGADLTDADLHSADLPRADLRDAHVENAGFRRADLRGAAMERATVVRSNLFGADLSGATPYGAVLRDLQCNAETEFGGHYPDDANEAAWTLRQFERLFRENALPEKARTAFVDRKRRRTAAAWADGDYGRAALAAGYGAAMGYGENPWRVVGASGVAILVAAVLYPIPGIRTGDGLLTYPPPAGLPATLPETARVLAESVYFSTVTFTTLGYGDVAPAGWGKALATAESFLGALLMALLVFVLGRRATW